LLKRGRFRRGAKPFFGPKINYKQFMLKTKEKKFGSGNPGTTIYFRWYLHRTMYTFM